MSCMLNLSFISATVSFAMVVRFYLATSVLDKKSIYANLSAVSSPHLGIMS